MEELSDICEAEDVRTRLAPYTATGPVVPMRKVVLRGLLRGLSARALLQMISTTQAEDEVVCEGKPCDARAQTGLQLCMTGGSWQ